MQLTLRWPVFCGMLGNNAFKTQCLTGMITIMKRSIWLLLCWWILAMPGMANPSAVTVKLDDLSSINLSPSSDYFVDQTNQLTESNVLNAMGWQPLKRDQLRFGLETHAIWLNMPVQTQGLVGKDALLVLNRIIDDVQVNVYQDNALISQWHQGAFLHNPVSFIGTNKNVMPITLKPNTHYRFLVRVQGTDSLIGSVKLWERNAYQTEDAYNLYAFIAYGVAVLAIALYNIAVFVSTQYRAFLYHAVYGVSFLICQSSQYGYLDVFLQHSVSGNIKDALILFCCFNAYTAIMGLIYVVVGEKMEYWFAFTLKAIVGVNVFAAFAAPFVPLHYGIVIFAITIGVGFVLGTSFSVFLFMRRDSRFWQQLLLVMIFSPSSVLLILSRFGIVNDSFWTEYWILIAIIGEMLLLSILMFSHIRQMQQLFWRSQYLDPRNHLPNILALRERLYYAMHMRLPHALTYSWVAGLEKMEVARGSVFRDEYLTALASLLERHLKQESFSLPEKNQKKLAPIVFYCEKNTLGFLTLPLNHTEHERLKLLLAQVFEILKTQYSYNLDVTPIIASCNATAMDVEIESLLQNTNVALSQCIQSNNALLLYNDDVGYNERRQITLLNDFESALANNQFYLEWQPQLDPSNQRLSGLEALVRWNHPVYGVISPTQFIPLLEQNLMITRLSAWVLWQVFTVSPAFFKQFPELDISINLSVYDLMSDTLLPILDEILRHTAADIPPRIIMEVTESVHMEDNVRVLKTVAALQARGFRISIDDFGAGYASFGYLQTLPANELKIDKRYTDTCHEASSQAIIRSIIDLANRLNMQIVVEGIEDKEQQDLFTLWGVHRLQGWRLGKPAQQHEILASF